MPEALSKNTSEKENTIPVPPVGPNGVGAEATAEELLSAQKKLFQAKKKSSVKAQAKPEVEAIKADEPELAEPPELEVELESPEKSQPEEKSSNVAKKLKIPTSLILGEKKESAKEEEGTPEADTQVAEPNIEKENNLKNLRQIAGKFKNERDTFQQKVAELEERLSNAAVEPLQAKIKEYEERIAKLEPLEIVFAINRNPKFVEKFIDGPNKIIAEINEIATSYGMDESYASEILQIKGRKETDEFLSSTLSSSTAQTDIKTLKQRYDALIREKGVVESKAKESLSAYQAAEETEKADRMAKRDTYLQGILEESWRVGIEMNSNLPEEQRIEELMIIPGEKDHNEQIATPTLNAAKELVKQGLDYIEQAIRTQSVISPKFSQWFATICQQAMATQMVNRSKNAIYREFEKVNGQLKKVEQFERPNIDGNGGIPTKKSTAKPKGAKDISAHIFNKVMASGPN